MDSDSTLTLTGNSYYTSLTNADSDNSNVVTGSYTWNIYEETEISSGSSSSSGSSPSSGPSGSSSAPSGSSSGPSGSSSDRAPPERPDGTDQGEPN